MLTDPNTSPARGSLRADHEARRLEHRTRRLDFVLGALKERAQAYESRGHVPRPLHDAIAGFAIELRQDRQRLAHLRRSPRA